MPLLLFLLFVGVPIAEIAVFIEAGAAIGVMPTLAIVIATAFAGTWLLRAQGLATFAKAQAAMNEGQVPVEQMVHGLFLAVAGILLLTPGFITDTAGLLLFVPSIRLALGKKILRALMVRGQVHVYGAGPGRDPRTGPGGQPPGHDPFAGDPFGGKPGSGGPIIEGEVIEEEGGEERPGKDKPSGRPNPHSPWRP